MLNQSLESGRALADSALERFIPPETTPPASIHKAMRHSVFAGGKRLRPILCMEAARMIAASRASQDADTPSLSRPHLARPGRPPLPPGIEDLGAAIEMLHTYSLIHDDLPALDNDDLRRGRPTCHVVFGEAIAILAGDALQTLAYEVMSRLACPAEARVRIIEELARGTGTINGMIGGQVMDLEAEHTAPNAETLETIHRSKTGALFTASLTTGGIYAGGSDSDIQRLRNFGHAVGHAFQIADDILDCTQSSAQLGKTAGKDAAASKATYPALFGLEKSAQMAATLVKEGCTELDRYGDRATTLQELAHYLVERKK